VLPKKHEVCFFVCKAMVDIAEKERGH
jgi:hypothetical protein